MMSVMALEGDAAERTSLLPGMLLAAINGEGVEECTEEDITWRTLHPHPEV